MRPRFFIDTDQLKKVFLCAKHFDAEDIIDKQTYLDIDSITKTRQFWNFILDKVLLERLENLLWAFSIRLLQKKIQHLMLLTSLQINYNRWHRRSKFRDKANSGFYCWLCGVFILKKVLKEFRNVYRMHFLFHRGQIYSNWRSKQFFWINSTSRSWRIRMAMYSLESIYSNRAILLKDFPISNSRSILVQLSILKIESDDCDDWPYDIENI